MELYENIKHRRKSLKLSQDELAKLTGYTDRTSISKIEAGKVDLPQSKIRLFAQALQTTEGELMGTTSNTPSPAKQTQLSPKEERDIARQLEATLSELSNPNSALMFDGEPLDDETRELLRASLENQFRMARIIAKEKYTPKKYRKDREDE